VSVSRNQSLAMSVEQGVPHTKAFDSTFTLLSEGYPFFQRRCDELGSDIFTTRLMGRRAGSRSTWRRRCGEGHQPSTGELLVTR